MTAVVLAICFIAALVAIVRMSNRHCPDTSTGEHEYIHTRTPEGWRLRCCRCGVMTAGISAFKRKA